MRRVDGIRAVTYDCWGTLLKDRDWEGAYNHRVSALNRFLDLTEEEARALMDEAWAKHDNAWKQVETFGPGRMAAYCLEARGIFDDDAIAELTQEFEEASMKHGVEAVDNAKETLEALKSKDIALGLVCDTGFTPGRVVRQPPLAGWRGARPSALRTRPSSTPPLSTLSSWPASVLIALWPIAAAA